MSDVSDVYKSVFKDEIINEDIKDEGILKLFNETQDIVNEESNK